MNLNQFLEEGSLLSLNNGHVVVGAGEREEFDNPIFSDLFYFQNFFLTKSTPWHRHHFQKEITLSAFKAFLQEGSRREESMIKWSDLDCIQFNKKFTALQSKISNKKLVKGVPYIFQEGEAMMTKERLCCSLLAAVEAAERYPLYLYGTWHREEGVLGATPELLFQRNKTSLSTVACAGTLSSKKKDSWRADPKLLHEHAIVVEGIIEALSIFGNVSQGTLGIVELKSLIHLLTPIKVMLHDDPQFTSIVDALHPTPALGAYPKREGMEWLRCLNESLPRGYFGAPVGYQGKQGDAICYVAIRNMQWEPGKVRLGAGCGVVEGSSLEAEWQELQLKLKSIKELLQLQTAN